MREQRRRRRAVADGVARLRRGLPQHARAEILLRIFELELFGYGHTVVTDERVPPLALDEHALRLRTERDAHGIGELPDSPARSRWDFVLRSADAAVWVSGAQPKGKDFDLSLDRRQDTGHWLSVTGVVREARGLQWVETKDGDIKAAAAPAAPAETEEPPVRVPAAPPPEVIFSAPTADERGVALDTTVRIQFSRDIDPDTVKGHVTIRYVGSPGGEPAPPVPAFTTAYRPGNRVLEITFAQPLERFQTLSVGLDANILGTDGQALKPWTVTFDLGG